jgi:hypothetical protein
VAGFCFTCESELVHAFVCAYCGDEECADCVDGNVCAECAFERESWAELSAVVERA